MNKDIAYVEFYRERQRIRKQIANPTPDISPEDWRALCKELQRLNVLIFDILTNNHGN